MNLFESGEFTLSSGAASAFRIECDALTQEDVETLALMISQMVGPFSDVIGVPRGGLRLAEALKPAAVLVGPVLIVDDVLTTGASITRVRDELHDRIKRENPRRYSFHAVGAVLFARGYCKPWVRALFSMPECFWVKRPWQEP